jgi:hypothetical protein
MAIFFFALLFLNYPKKSKIKNFSNCRNLGPDKLTHFYKRIVEILCSAGGIDKFDSWFVCHRKHTSLLVHDSNAIQIFSFLVIQTAIIKNEIISIQLEICDSV